MREIWRDAPNLGVYAPVTLTPSASKLDQTAQDGPCFDWPTES